MDITPGYKYGDSISFSEKGGKLFMFNGWHRLDEKKHWQDVEVVQVRPCSGGTRRYGVVEGRWG